MNDENFGILFDLNFSKNRLFCLEKVDIQSPSEILVLYIDTSSSMIAKLETLAKSVALYMANTTASLKARHRTHNK